MGRRRGEGKVMPIGGGMFLGGGFRGVHPLPQATNYFGYQGPHPFGQGFSGAMWGDYGLQASQVGRATNPYDYFGQNPNQIQTNWQNKPWSSTLQRWFPNYTPPPIPDMGNQDLPGGAPDPRALANQPPTQYQPNKWPMPNQPFGQQGNAMMDSGYQQPNLGNDNLLGNGVITGFRNNYGKPFQGRW
jgi:hypothetical protein